MNKLTICELDELIKKNDEENRLAKNMIKSKLADIMNYINSWLIKKLNIGPAMVLLSDVFQVGVLERQKTYLCYV